MNPLRRRDFLKTAVWGAASAASARLKTSGQPAPAHVEKAPASERVRVGCVGVGGRAGYLMQTFAGLSNADVAVICDIDAGRLDAAAQLVAARQGKAPSVETDFRRLLIRQWGRI